MDEMPGEVARLRRAADDRPHDGAGERIGDAEIVLGFVLEKRSDVTERRRARAQHVRIRDRVDQLVKPRGIETVLQAQPHRRRGARGGGVRVLAGTAVAPALSPCQPLLKPTSCRLRRSGVMVIRPPRFGTSCHISPLARDRSTGLTMKKVAMYPTLPFTRGARSMSVMSVLSGSFGSSSPNARPVSVSYAMSS